MSISLENIHRNIKNKKLQITVFVRSIKKIRNKMETLVDKKFVKKVFLKYDNFDEKNVCTLNRFFVH